MQNRPHRPDCPAPAFQEPEMRRWPHPISCGDGELPNDTALHFIRCALSYQNQLLADIKTLLERLVVDAGPENVEK